MTRQDMEMQELRRKNKQLEEEVAYLKMVVKKMIRYVPDTALGEMVWDALHKLNELEGE